MTDGASAVVRVSERLLERRPELRARPMATITGRGHRTAGLPLGQELRASVDDVYVLPHVHHTIADALRRSGLAGIEQVDEVEVHDCVSMTEYMIIDHLGITPPGASRFATLDIGGSATTVASLFVKSTSATK
ncbi:hypothetical protein [Rhodococcus marinonascens]|uniref:hypothetical protein n=1 Tax=Rhodococcus marinonascens TaxID=38311 RepID=UPI00147616A5|nr:hypothetical protein [Rhodococcus marinonascens]